MEKILLTGLILLILLSTGAIGTVISRYDMGMMQGNFRETYPRGCPMMDDNAYFDEYCSDTSYDECEEMHEECEEHMHTYCEHDDTIGEDGRAWRGCPMMR